MLALLASAHADLTVLFVILALVAFGAAVVAAFRGLLVVAAACALIAILILVFGVR